MFVIITVLYQISGTKIISKQLSLTTKIKATLIVTATLKENCRIKQDELIRTQCGKMTMEGSLS